MFAYGVNTEMNASTTLKYNLQFFAEEPGGEEVPPDGGSEETPPVDAAAFAELISEKDKKLEEMEEQIRKLQKSNAELIVRVNAGSKASEPKSFEENLITLNGWKPRKE